MTVRRLDIPQEQIDLVAARVKRLPGFPDFPPFERAYEHMGALLTDAGLQAGIGYKSTVVPRVRRILAQWPDATTTTTFLGRVQNEGLNDVLSWSDPEKPRRITALTELLKSRRVDNIDELASWLDEPSSRELLTSIRGIGDKTADYIANLAGRPTAAVDRHLITFVSGSGVDTASYDAVYQLLAAVATQLALDLGALDRVIWKSVEDGTYANASYSSTHDQHFERALASLKLELGRVTLQRDEALRILDDVRRVIN
jgi:hypothetical protein